MGKVKGYLEDMLLKMTFEQRICWLMTVCQYSSEDARDYAELFETVKNQGTE